VGTTIATIAEGQKQPETFRTFELSRLSSLGRVRSPTAALLCVIRVVPIGDGQAARASSAAGEKALAVCGDLSLRNGV